MFTIYILKIGYLKDTVTRSHKAKANILWGEGTNIKITNDDGHFTRSHTAIMKCSLYILKIGYLMDTFTRSHMAKANILWGGDTTKR